MKIEGYDGREDDGGQGTLGDWGGFLAQALEQWDVEPGWIQYACEKPWKWAKEFAYFQQHGQLPEDP